MPLLNKVDISIYEAIRLVLVARNYLPDITMYNTLEDFEAAKVALADTLPGKVVTEVFGVGKIRNRSKLNSNRIVIDRVGMGKGSIGGFPETRYIPTQAGTNGNFDKIQLPRFTKNPLYHIRITTLNTFWRVTLEEIIEAALQSETYLTLIDEVTGDLTTDAIFCEQRAYQDVSMVDFPEVLYTFEVKDLFITESKTLTANIPPLISIHPEYTVEPSAEDSIIQDGTVTPPAIT